MSSFKPGTRVKGQYNGVWLRGTIDESRYFVRDSDGFVWTQSNFTNLTELKGMEAKKTECKRGHSLVGYNAYVDTRGLRRCRECAAAANRAYRKQVKEALV